MKIRNLFLPAFAVGTAIVFTTPKQSEGFALLGHSLSVTETNFRVFNNFQDSQSNNNTTADPNWPGYTGAIMAIWKGVMEWGSRKHGDGSGDPHQPGLLGSGNSNYDPFFTGEATNVGSIGNNIHSALNQNGGGTLAFMQGGSFGWWVRYYDNHTWSDGPSQSLPFGQSDLQGVACHEQGHSLGLNHTTASGATMTAFASGVVDRSINGDDIAGVQAIYGTVDNNLKPRITSITALGGNQIQINGANFTVNFNEVWFTRLNATSPSPSANEEPIKLTGVSSTSGGTVITVNTPAGAGPGDVMVKRNSATQSSTSNPWPFDPAALPIPPPTFSTVTPSSVPVLGVGGTATVLLSGSDFTQATGLTVDGFEVGVAGNFTGSWSVLNDSTISVTLPLVLNAGMVDIELTTPSGTGTIQVELVSPAKSAGTEGILATEPTNNWDISDGFSFGMAGEELDIHILYLSTQNGPSGDPAIFELEIGNNDPASFFLVGSFLIPARFWSRLDVPSFTTNDVPPGFFFYFESVVAHPGPLNDYSDFPWGSSNAISLFTIP
jgi:hypothetical protein